MKSKAIVYVSESGHTKKYAELLGERINLPVYDLKASTKKLAKGTEIIYLGWLMAGKVQGYKKAAKRYNINAVCGVGMSRGPSQLEDMQKANSFGKDVAVFCLQGGFELEKLHGIYKLIMKIMIASLKKESLKKQDKSSGEDTVIELMLKGCDFVSADNLKEILCLCGQM